MRNDLLTAVESYTTKNRLRRIWRKSVQAMACFVVFCTTYALILPAITQESDTHCGLREHVHTDACYEQIAENPARQLACSAERFDLHFHSEQCADEAGNLICGMADYVAHAHNGDCLDETGTLVCTIPEREQHIHADGCYSGEDQSLICKETQAEIHVHSEDCFSVSEAAEPALTCQLPEDAAHTHSRRCYGTWERICAEEEHQHTKECHADVSADLETPEIWEQSISSAELSGVWNEDIVAIARTQLGYVESTKNYIVLDDGKIKGYTRYGEWYGNPYGDWCAMFVSFCLDYAGVEGMPLESGVSRWIQKLSEQENGLYQSQGSYVPSPGELIFFDWEMDGDPDHVGIVHSLTMDEKGTAVQIHTIEGNSTNRVQECTYDMDDGQIFGYGQLPAQLTASEQSAVDLVIAKIAALPAADEINKALAVFNQGGDAQGYYADVSQLVAEAYYDYSHLSTAQKKAVVNADQLMELEHIWSVTIYEKAITSDAPTATWYTSTRDFVELNLYDYNGNINEDYWAKNPLYPGFQWSGGAYNQHSVPQADADEGIPDSYTDRHNVESIDFGNSLITDFTYGGGSDGAYSQANNATVVGGVDHTNTHPINCLSESGIEGDSDKAVGYSTTDQTESQKVMKYELESGYPALSDDTVLDYLFKDSASATKVNTQSIDGLFQQNEISGTYAYNSRLNHAEYTDNFFQLYDEVITPNFILYPFGNFLPLNQISDLTKATQVGAVNKIGGMSQYVEQIIADLDNNTEGLGSQWRDTQVQLAAMLEEYKENWNLAPRTIDQFSNNWINLSSAHAIRDFHWKDEGDVADGTTEFITQDFLNRMYNIDWDVQTNFFFGIEMKLDFLMPKDGLTGHDNGSNEANIWAVAEDGTAYLTGSPDGIADYPMEFNFAGDDDVWVYIDGVLFLDLSGIQHNVAGRINFREGKVEYYQLDDFNTGTVSDTPYQTFTFAEILTAAGKSTDVLNEKGTFKDYTTHSFNFYYVEWGAGSSLCQLDFNFPLVRKNSITIAKENIAMDGGELDDTVLGNPDYYFNIVNDSNLLFVGPDSITGITRYKVQDSAGNILKNADGTDKIFTTDQYGIFTLKAGQSALFEGIPENKGRYYIQELLKAQDNDQYPSACIYDQESRSNGLIDWQYRTYFSGAAETDPDHPIYIGPYDYQWYGRSSCDTVSATNSACYEQTGRVDVSRLGQLSVAVATLEGADAGQTFDLAVTLDDEKLPVGTEYTVGGEARTVTDEGIVTIAPGQTATISNILSGTQFEVRETNTEGYMVQYAAQAATDSNEIDTSSDSTAIKGVVRTGETVNVLVANSQQDAGVLIPVTKSFVNGVEDAQHQYTFTLTQVTDASGTAVEENGKQLNLTKSFSGNTYSDSFELSYLKSEITSLPATFYYQIEESGEESDSLDNTQKFIAEVLVEESGEGIAASLVSINGSAQITSADFVNTLAGSLTLEAVINGSDEVMSQEFTYDMILTPAADMTLPGQFGAVYTDADGNQQQLTLPILEDGRITFDSLGNGETVTILGIPAGTAWSITESGAEGFIVTTRTGETSAEGLTANGTITPGELSVVYTNTQTYVLPETGGSGTTLYTMAGTALMLCSAAYLLYRRIKRGREAFLFP